MKSQEGFSLSRRLGTVSIAGVLVFGVLVSAQPDPRRMSGIPLPDPQLSTGTISVRVIRGQMSNNVADHPVELTQGDELVTVNTDADGRATFLKLDPGSSASVSTVHDGVRLDSQQFSVPNQGGIRLLLVGEDVANVTSDEVVLPGEITLGSESRIAVELGEESVTVFYFLDIMNWQDVSVEPRSAVSVSVPEGAEGTTVLRESSPRSRVDGTTVSLPGPFAPGMTPLRMAYVLPYSGDRLAIEQQFSADLEALLVVVEKWGDMNIVSEQISRRADMGPDAIGGDTTYIFGAGSRVQAGVPVAFEISGLPHHNRLPATLTLALSGVMLFAGILGAMSGVDDSVENSNFQRLEAKKNRLFQELVKLEYQRRTEKVGITKYSSRRATIIAAIEVVYRDLDAEADSVSGLSLHSTIGQSARAEQTSTAG